MSGRFEKGRSGNPAGRPKKRRPHVSAFDIIFDKTLTVTQNGVERELSVDEALELQTYQAALKGSRMAIRKVLKMIEKREAYLATRDEPPTSKVTTEIHHSAENANEAMSLLGIIEKDSAWPENHPRWKLATWAAQAALSRPGRRKIEQKEVDNIKMFTTDSDRLKWPRGRLA